MTLPYRSRKAYLSGCYKAVKRTTIYGTAEAVPFVQQSLPQPLRVSEGFWLITSNGEWSTLARAPGYTGEDDEAHFVAVQTVWGGGCTAGLLDCQAQNGPDSK
jgi:hypothetical protein